MSPVASHLWKLAAFGVRNITVKAMTAVAEWIMISIAAPLVTVARNLLKHSRCHS